MSSTDFASFLFCIIDFLSQNRTQWRRWQPKHKLQRHWMGIMIMRIRNVERVMCDDLIAVPIKCKAIYSYHSSPIQFESVCSVHFVNYFDFFVVGAAASQQWSANSQPLKYIYGTMTPWHKNRNRVIVLLSVGSNTRQPKHLQFVDTPTQSLSSFHFSPFHFVRLAFCVASDVVLAMQWKCNEHSRRNRPSYPLSHPFARSQWMHCNWKLLSQV